METKCASIGDEGRSSRPVVPTLALLFAFAPLKRLTRIASTY